MATHQFPFDGNCLDEKFQEGDRYAQIKVREQQNVDAVRRMLTALSIGDVDTFVKDLDPEVELEINCPEYFPWIRQAKGIGGITAAVIQNYGGLEDQTPTVTSLVAQGDMVEICADETGRAKGLDRAYNITGLVQFKFRDGKAVLLREIVSDRTTSSGA